MSEHIKGIAASDGVAVAKAYLLVQPDLSFNKKTVADYQQEQSRLDEALKQSQKELEKIKDHAEKTIGTEEAQVFEAHIMILSDPEFIGAVKQEIADQKENAEAALSDISSNFIATFEAMKDNDYMKERAADIKDVTKRVMSHLLGVNLPDPTMIDEEVVIVAEDLAPSDTAQLNRKYVKAFVTDVGGRTAHSAIMARSLEIPAVVGTDRATKIAQEKGNVKVAVNGITGEVIIDPSAAEIAEFEQAGRDFVAQKTEWAKLKNEATTTADGKHFTLAANIGTPKDLTGVMDNGAEAIGLYRTEFLYMDSAELPTEEDQFAAYRKVLESMAGKQVVVRTMDIGGDKHLPYLPLPEEQNPFLGYRAIRISLDREDIFRTQLRALIRASHYGKLGIMFPMIATVNEFKKAKAIYQEEYNNLKAAGTPVSDEIQVGMMMEIPAAAVLADKFAKYADFFSIGTNDLIQYSMAADRGNDRVSYLYQPYNPAILRLVKNIIDSAHQEGKWVGMCGEAAGDPVMDCILIGLGLDEYSMSATSILKIRSLMKKIDTSKVKELAEKAVTESVTNEDNIALVKQYIDL